MPPNLNQGVRVTTKPAYGTSAHRKWVVSKIGDYASEHDVDVLQIPRDAFVVWSQGTEYSLSTRDFDAVGGWARIRQYANDELASGLAPERGELGQSREVQHRNTHRRALERLAGDVEYISTRLRESLADAVTANPPKIQALKKTPKWNTPVTHEIVAHISDTHFGQCVDSEEVLGGKYDWSIAARRMGLFVHTIASKGTPKTALRLVFNGDLIEGKIHDDDRGVDMMSSQIDGTRQLITAMIDFLRSHFSRVEVICQSGNHERWPFRGPGRPTAQKYDSATTVVMRGVEQIFRNEKDVRFSLPLTPFSVWESCGHRFLATHGDDVFQIGNPSKGIKLDGLFARLHHMEAGGAFGGKINAVMLGHWHYPMVCRIPGMKPQPFLTVNGCASGRTAYSQTLGIAASSPVQTFWEVNEQLPIHHFTMVDLDTADFDSKWEEIVPVPTPIGTPLNKQGAPTDFYALMNFMGKKR